jgi:hypothetical protein
MIVEIGHFYMNEVFDANKLDYLHEQRFSEDDVLILFIDDYSFPEKVLDLAALKDSCEKILGRTVQIEYESDMVRYFDLAILYLDPAKLKRISVNDVPTEILYDDRKIYDCQTKRPTCQMLSYIWTLQRLNAFYKTCDKLVLTVIDRKYMKLEQRVYSMIPVQHRHKIFYRFF